MADIPDDVVERALAKFFVEWPVSDVVMQETYRAAMRSALRVGMEWERGAIAKFSEHPNWSLEFKSPVYCDDGDQERCWVVHEVSGGINDREWTVIGKGDTAISAMIAAIRARSRSADREG